MTEDIETPTQPTADGASGADGSPGADGPRLTDTVPPSSLQERATAIADERPEVAVGAAFAGGFVLALILRRLAR